MTFRYPRNVVVLGLKGQGHRVNKCICHTNDYYAYVNAYQQYGLGLNSVSAF